MYIIIPSNYLRIVGGGGGDRESTAAGQRAVKVHRRARGSVYTVKTREKNPPPRE